MSAEAPDVRGLDPWMAVATPANPTPRRRGKVVIDCPAEDAQRLADLLSVAFTCYATKSERDRAILAACASARVEGGA